MSGLYNMLFGVNQLAGPLLAGLHVDHQDIPRFRDCFLKEDGTEIVIYARVGGGNRAEYKEEIEVIRRRAGFLRDEDDSFDNTYALFYFAVPEDLKDACLRASEAGLTVNISKRWEDAMKALKKHTT